MLRRERAVDDGWGFYSLIRACNILFFKTKARGMFYWIKRKLLGTSPKLYQNRWAAESAVNTVPRPHCHCCQKKSTGKNGQLRWSEPELHSEIQDTQCPGWKRLIELVETAASDHRQIFSPAQEMKPEEWNQIVTLPPSIAKLKSVRQFTLYGSSLVRIPPEIGEMSSLEEFSPYTSYRLHWFPYEITRCKNLKESTVSTRALYGNYKYRPPFPKLPQIHDWLTPKNCSVCNMPFGENTPLQFWVSLNVATDVLPLLVDACSRKCISMIPTPPQGYIRKPHRGGLGLSQPKTLL